jgi:hypothetical protein
MLHEEYLQQRLEAGEKLGDKASVVKWDDLSEEFRNSSRRNARDVPLLLASVGYTITPAHNGDSHEPMADKEVELLAQQVHRRWLEERLAGGWRLGPEWDDQCRVHPDLVPWEALSEERRDVDRHFVKKLPKLLESLGLQISKRESI